MATAVEPSEPRTPTSPIGFADLASLFGALYVDRRPSRPCSTRVPAVWEARRRVGTSAGGAFAGDFEPVRVIVQFAALVALLLWFGTLLLGGKLRSRAFAAAPSSILLTAATLIFFGVAKWVALTVSNSSSGLIAVGPCCRAVPGLPHGETVHRARRARAGWLQIEEQGWFSTARLQESRSAFAPAGSPSWASCCWAAPACTP